MITRRSFLYVSICGLAGFYLPLSSHSKTINQIRKYSDHVTYLAFDPLGDAYEINLMRNSIIRRNIDNEIEWEIGYKGTSPGQFDQPVSITFDKNINIYVLDYGNSRIQVFNRKGHYLYEFGS